MARSRVTSSEATSILASTATLPSGRRAAMLTPCTSGVTRCQSPWAITRPAASARIDPCALAATLAAPLAACSPWWWKARGSTGSRNELTRARGLFDRRTVESPATLRTAVSLAASRLETGAAPGGPEAVRMLLRIEKAGRVLTLSGLLEEAREGPAYPQTARLEYRFSSRIPLRLSRRRALALARAHALVCRCRRRLALSSPSGHPLLQRPTFLRYQFHGRGDVVAGCARHVRTGVE
eukprot:scaffold14984_cov69-Phaeocystis_antarctica.AAC.12